MKFEVAMLFYFFKKEKHILNFKHAKIIYIIMEIFNKLLKICETKQNVNLKNGL